MAPTLADYLRDRRPKGFRSAPSYFPLGDYLTYFVSDEPCHARRVDDVVTVYLSNDTDRLVGCKVKGVKHILKTAGDFGVGLGDAAFRLGFFFFAGAAPDRVRHEPVVRWYESLQAWAGVTVPRDELTAAD